MQISNIYQNQPIKEPVLSSLSHVSCPLIKISDFLQMKNISVHNFWLTDRNYASLQDIISFCVSCGYKIQVCDQIYLRARLFKDQEIISMGQFFSQIPFWKQNSKSIINDLTYKRSSQLIQQLQYKQQKRPKSSNFTRTKINTQLTQKYRNLDRQNSASKFKLEKQALLYIGNNSQKYLQKHRQRQQLLQKHLAQTIDKTQNQYEYGMLLKINEINEYNRDKNSNQTYRAYKSADGTIRVRLFELSKFIKEINLKDFDRIYKGFKKNNKEKKEWTFPLQTENKENKAVHSLKAKNARKTHSQQQLKSLLVNTVNLTNILKEQIRIFKKKGIYGSQL